MKEISKLWLDMPKTLLGWMHVTIVFNGLYILYIEIHTLNHWLNILYTWRVVSYKSDYRSRIIYLHKELKGKQWILRGQGKDRGDEVRKEPQIYLFSETTWDT